MRDLVDQQSRERKLVHSRNRVRAFVVEECDFIVIASHGILHAIGDE
jgi:hypothetical protein